MKCPICQQDKQIIDFDHRRPLAEQYGRLLGFQDAPLYQISYPGQKEYVSPRCSDCIDKVLQKKKKR